MGQDKMTEKIKTYLLFVLRFKIVNGYGYTYVRIQMYIPTYLHTCMETFKTENSSFYSFYINPPKRFIFLHMSSILEYIILEGIPPREKQTARIG